MQILNGLNSGQPLAAFTGLVVGVIRFRRAIRMSWEWRTRNLCSPGWIALLQFHPDSSRKAKQSNSSGICLVYYLSLNFWDWNKLWFHAEVSRPLWCVYVRTYVSDTHAAFVNLTSFVPQPIKSGGSWEGFIFLFMQLVGLLRQPWRKKFYLTGEIK